MSTSRFFEAIIRHPRTVLLVALFLSAVSIIYTWQKLEFLTGRDDLMPANAAFQHDYQAYRAAFGDQEEIAVVVESDDPALVSSFSDALYQRLSEEKRLFLDILYPGGLDYFRQNGLLFMPLAELETMGATIAKVAPTLVALAEDPSINTLFITLTEQIEDYLQQPSDNKLQGLAFMLGLLDKGFSDFNGQGNLLSMDVLFSGKTDGEPSMLETAGKQQVLAIRPLKEEDSFVPAEQAIKKIRADLQILRQKEEFRTVTAGITGIPVLEYEEMSTSMNDMTKASVLSLLLTTFLLLVAFRGIKNTLAAMTSLLVAISIAFGMATLLVGHLNILSMAFAVMLLGLGVEYGIQVVLRHQELLQHGDFRQTLLEALSSNLRPVLLAFITTALAFLTFLLTDFRGIAELGIIAAAGLLICFITTFTVLPATLVLVHRKTIKMDTLPDNPETQADSKTVHPWVSRILSRPGLIVAATAALSITGALLITRVPFDFNMLNLQAKGLESVQYAYKLMKSKENSGYFAVSLARDNDQVEQLTRQFEALPTVSHVVSMLTLVPDQQKAKLAEISRMKQLLAEMQPVEYEDNLYVMELPATFEEFRDVVVQLSDRLKTDDKSEATLVAAFLTTLDGFFAELEKEQDGNALTMLRELQESMFAPLPARLEQLKASLDANYISGADIPEQLRQRFIGNDGQLLLQVVSAQEIFEEGPLAEFVNQIKSVDPHATGEPVSVYESFKILKKSYLQAFLYASGGMVVVLLLAFRSIRPALLGITPLAAGLLLMVGGMWLCGLKFNVANIIVMPLLLGVGIDSAIYIISRHLRGEESPLQVATSSAGKGVFLNAITILFSFGALMVAHHQGVFSIGAVMSLGMTTIVLAFLLLLPALLLLSDRHRKPDSD